MISPWNSPASRTRCQPFPGEDAEKIVAEALGAPLDQLFRQFDTQPVASASVAQVHYAVLQDGTEVAVKVLRPGIEHTIERDLALLDTLARLAERYAPETRRLHPREVVNEYHKTIHGELDLMREAANASRLRVNFENSALLYVPKIYWDFTRTNVMVMERVAGIPIGNVAALKEAGVDMKKLAHDGVEIFFTQAFRDGFFHADMHPGNIFVSPGGQYRAVDFGIMGTLTERDQHYIAENFLAFFNRDYRAVAETHVRAGWVDSDIRLEEFEAAIRAVCEPIFAKPLKDISFGRLLLRLFQTARRFNMEVQPQLVLLQKTLFNIEGLGRQLYPDLDLWETAKPFLEQWTRTQFGPDAFLKTLKREFPRWWRMLPETPAAAFDFLRKAGNGELSLHWRSAELDKFATRVARAPPAPAPGRDRQWPVDLGSGGAGGGRCEHCLMDQPGGLVVGWRGPVAAHIRLAAPPAVRQFPAGKLLLRFRHSRHPWRSLRLRLVPVLRLLDSLDPPNDRSSWR